MFRQTITDSLANDGRETLGAEVVAADGEVVRAEEAVVRITTLHRPIPGPSRRAISKAGNRDFGAGWLVVPPLDILRETGITTETKTTIAEGMVALGAEIVVGELGHHDQTLDQALAPIRMPGMKAPVSDRQAGVDALGKE